MQNQDRVRKGEFIVPQDGLETAQDVFADRDPQSQDRGKGARGPITTDVRVYELTNGILFDYPGVDTPTENPKQAIADMPFPDENPGFGNDMMAVDPHAEASSVRENVEQQSKSLFNSLFKE